MTGELIALIGQVGLCIPATGIGVSIRFYRLWALKYHFVLGRKSRLTRHLRETVFRSERVRLPIVKVYEQVDIDLFIICCQVWLIAFDAFGTRIENFYLCHYLFKV